MTTSPKESKTKEGILAKHYPDFDIESGWMFDGPVSQVFEAMEIYARSRAIEFAKFLIATPYEYVYGNYDGEAFFDGTPEEFYEIFSHQTEK
jgi:hypothetical protein